MHRPLRNRGWAFGVLILGKWMFLCTVIQSKSQASSGSRFTVSSFSQVQALFPFNFNYEGRNPENLACDAISRLNLGYVGFLVVTQIEIQDRISRSGSPFGGFAQFLAAKRGVEDSCRSRWRGKLRYRLTICRLKKENWGSRQRRNRSAMGRLRLPRLPLFWAQLVATPFVSIATVCLQRPYQPWTIDQKSLNGISKI